MFGVVMRNIGKWMKQIRPGGLASHSCGLMRGDWKVYTDRIDCSVEVRCMDRIIREVPEIKLHPSNLNREDGSSMSGS